MRTEVLHIAHKKAKKACRRKWPPWVQPSAPDYGLSLTFVQSVHAIAALGIESRARLDILGVCFGPNQTPLLQLDFRGQVLVDATDHAHLATLDDFRKTSVLEPTDLWDDSNRFQLDGLNKTMNDWDHAYYGYMYHAV
ncbi:hypothetical protein GJ744_003771 [Endocarpon pusillum]|uniref:Uncharacterized protein n=1 Tax=Endocarpon pusillum TaxID=364733 RepID=A0A8H7AM60_9EURO|nr:hypothetical protein GJ744_003771 [Endocarpon pusillum]